MNWSNKSLSFLGLDGTDVKILDAMAQARTYQEAAKDIAIPRTSVAFRAKGLMDKGLIMPVKRGKRYRYIAVTEEQLSAKLKAILGDIDATVSERKGYKVKVSTENEFIIHVGAREITAAYERIASMNRDQRIKAIQGIKAWKALLEKLSPQQLIRFNKSVIDNRLIMDGIIQESSYRIYGEMIRKDPTKLKEAAESLIGRMADYVYVPDDVFDVPAEIWLFRSTAFIINWPQEVAMEIINPDIMAFLRDMFEFVKAAGTKIDHNKAMKELLGK